MSSPMKVVDETERSMVGSSFIWLVAGDREYTLLVAVGVVGDRDHWSCETVEMIRC